MVWERVQWSRRAGGAGGREGGRKEMVQSVQPLKEQAGWSTDQSHRVGLTQEGTQLWGCNRRQGGDWGHVAIRVAAQEGDSFS